METNTTKIMSVIIPAYHATEHITNLLASIQMQTIRDNISVIISNDHPDDNGKYEFVKDRFPELDIKILDCDKNYGPGIARQRGIDVCETPWFTCCDADDVFYDMFSCQNLVNNITPNAVMVQGTWVQQVSQGNLNAAQKMQIIQSGGQIPPRVLPMRGPQLPWFFGRLIRLEFVKAMDIKVSGLRAIK